jgi:hypothetical protein
MVEHAANEGFMLSHHSHILLHKKSPGDLVEAFATYIYTPRRQAKWMDLLER